MPKNVRLKWISFEGQDQGGKVRRLLIVNLTTAAIQDAAGAEQIIEAVHKRWPWMKHLFAYGAYDRGKLMSRAADRDCVSEFVRKLADQTGFHDLPRRWVVERTFGWMPRWHGPVRAYERCLSVPVPDSFMTQ